MKNSKEYSKKVASFHKALKKNYKKLEMLSFEAPIDALVFAVVSEFFSNEESLKIFDRINEHFIDKNDLRVSRTEEIVDVLGGGINDETKQVAANLTAALRKIFEEYDSICIDEIFEAGKRQAKQTLEDLNALSPFVVNFVMLKVMQAHALPMTVKMVNYLKENGFVDPEADDNEINGFIERNISANDLEEFYLMLRLEAEQKKAEPKGKKKVSSKDTEKSTDKKTSKKKAVKKTAKKSKK